MGLKTWYDVSANNKPQLEKTSWETRTKDSFQATNYPIFTSLANSAGQSASPASEVYRVGTVAELSSGQWNYPLASLRLTIERYASGAVPGVNTPLESVSANVVQGGIMDYLIPSGTQGQFLRGVAVATDVYGKGRIATAYSTGGPTGDGLIPISAATTPYSNSQPIISGNTDPSGSLSIASYGVWVNVASVPSDLRWVWQVDGVDSNTTAGSTTYSKTSSDGGHAITLRVWANGYEVESSVISDPVNVTAPTGLFPGFVPRSRWGVIDADTSTTSGLRDVVYGNLWQVNGVNAAPIAIANNFTYYMQVIANPTDPFNPATPNTSVLTALNANGSGISHKLSQYALDTPIMHNLWGLHVPSGNIYRLNDPADVVTIGGVTAPYGYYRVPPPPTPALSAPSFDQAPKLTPVGPVDKDTTISMQQAAAAGNPVPTVTNEWYRDGVLIANSSANTYVTLQSDNGKKIKSRNKAVNTQGTAYSDYSNEVTVTVGGGTTSLPPLPASVLASAMSQPLATYSDDNNGFKNSGYNNGFQWMEAYASFQGDTTADSAVLQQMRKSLEGANCPGWAGGYGVQVHFSFAAAAAFARRTPRIWNQFTTGTTGEQAKITALMQAGLVCACCMTGNGNKQNNFIKVGTKDWATSGNTNFRAAKPAVILACRMFFGSAQAMKSYLNSFDRSVLRSTLTTLGLTNAVTAFCSKAVYSDDEVERIVGSKINDTANGPVTPDWRWQRTGGSADDPNAGPFTLDDIDDLVTYCLNRGFNNVVESGIGGTAANDWIGPGIQQATPPYSSGKIMQNASQVQNRGKIGMADEFDSVDDGGKDTGGAGGPRSAGHYVSWMYRLCIGICAVAMCEGTLAPGRADRASALNRVNIGHIDYVKKSTEGYYSWSHGVKEADWTPSKANVTYGGSYLHQMWPLIWNWAQDQ